MGIFAGLNWVDPGRRFATVAVVMKMLFVADLHYALKQFDWLLANVARYDAVDDDVIVSGKAAQAGAQIIVTATPQVRIPGQQPETPSGDSPSR